MDIKYFFVGGRKAGIMILGLSLLLMHILPVGLLGLMLAAYFSAILSNTDSYLIAASGNLLSYMIVDKLLKIAKKINMKYKYYSTLEGMTFLEKQRVVDFLHEHLEQYGDPKKDIRNAIDYALSPYPLAGGFIMTAEENGSILGGVVMNKTGMKGYIPENVLVYIAVHKKYRGKGIGKELMKHSLKFAKGAIKLHVEPDNPARFLYENLNFTNRYLEMRLDPGK